MLTEDGKLNFLPFQMLPDTIVVKDVVGDDGLSVIPLKELVALGCLEPNAGTPADPLRVEGKLLLGKQHCAPKYTRLMHSVQCSHWHLLIIMIHSGTVTANIMYRPNWRLTSINVMADADAQHCAQDKGIWAAMASPASSWFNIPPATHSAGQGRHED